jgi:HAD superfamily hydrolase (TIGR01509 family)
LGKAILWDMDGVIADTAAAHLMAWQALLAERGETISERQFAETFGMANPEILCVWYGERLSDTEIRALGIHKEELFRQKAIEQVRLLPGVLDWLQWGRRQGVPQVVASSGEMANIVAIVHKLGIANYFDGLVAGGFMPRSKPDPAIFLQAAAAAGAQPSDCLVIEDGIVGVEAARRAGIRCLAVTTTHAAHKLADADLVLPDLTALNEATMWRLLGA